MKRDEMNQLLKCILCGKSFSIQDAKFIKPISDDIVYGEGFPVRCISHGAGMYKTNNPRSSEGDTIVTCPHCEGIHVRPY